MAVEILRDIAKEINFSDVGFPSICYDYWICTENRGSQGKLNWMLGEKRRSLREAM